MCGKEISNEYRVIGERVSNIVDHELTISVSVTVMSKFGNGDPGGVFSDILTWYSFLLNLGASSFTSLMVTDTTAVELASSSLDGTPSISSRACKRKIGQCVHLLPRTTGPNPEVLTRTINENTPLVLLTASLSNGLAVRNSPLLLSSKK